MNKETPPLTFAFTLEVEKKVQKIAKKPPSTSSCCKEKITLCPSPAIRLGVRERILCWRDYCGTNWSSSKLGLGVFFPIIQGTAEMGYQGLRPASPETGGEDRAQQNVCVWRIAVGTELSTKHHPQVDKCLCLGVNYPLPRAIWAVIQDFLHLCLAETCQLNFHEDALCFRQG